MTKQVRKLIFASSIAAAYIVLTVIFMPISFGQLQFRISEILTILPYFFPVAVPGLFVGCFIANLMGPYFFGDAVIGSIATLCAALITMRIGKSIDNERISTKALACVPTVVINAILVGAFLSSYMVGAGEADAFWAAFAANILWVGFGQLVVVYTLGLPLMIYLPRMGVIDRLKQIYEKEDNNRE